MLEIESTVDAGQVVNVEPQEQEAVEVESVPTEVASEQPQEKPQQSKDENAKFAEVRREAERKAQDKLIAEMYGATHGIYTKADYDKAVQAQREAEMLEKLRDGDTDPEEVKSQLFKEWETTDPRIKEYEQIRVENYTQKQINELNAELKEMGLDSIGTLDDIAKLPSASIMTRHIEQGKTLAEAYFLANKSEIIKAQASKIQQETIKKIQANSDTVGSLADNGQETPLYTRDQVDKMSVAEINKNYDLVMRSMKSWK